MHFIWRTISIFRSIARGHSEHIQATRGPSYRGLRGWGKGEGGRGLGKGEGGGGGGKGMEGGGGGLTMI